MSGKNYKIVEGDISDGSHTFDELYEHRYLLFINLVLASVNQSCYSFLIKEHMYPKYFLLLWNSPAGQISYHIPNDYLHLLEGKIEEKTEHTYDGHTAKDVLHRLVRIARDSNG